MKFDVIIGNPPYQNTVKNGSGSGSGTAPLYVLFTQLAEKLCKTNGFISLVTPSAIFTGSEDRTKYLVGRRSLFSVNKIDFTADQYFEVGDRLCRWSAFNHRNPIIADVSGGRQIVLQKTAFVVEDVILDSIIQKLFSDDAMRLSFTNKGGTTTSAETEKSNRREGHFQYEYDINGKTFFLKHRCKNYSAFKIFVPQLTNPKTFQFYTAENKGANQSTYTYEVNSLEEGKQITKLLNHPIYLWIINQTRSSSRLQKTYLDRMPIVEIEEVLSKEQLDYIRSQMTQ